MHLEFNLENLELWSQYYSDQAGQVGYGIVDGFCSTPHQRSTGMGSFSWSLFCLAVPIFKSAAHSVGRQALSSGVSFALDLVQGTPLAETISPHGREGALKLLNKASEVLLQKGRGLGSSPKRINRNVIDIFTKKRKSRKRK